MLVVYGLVITAMLVPVAIYLLAKKKPRFALLLGGVLLIMAGIWVLFFTITFDKVDLAMRGSRSEVLRAEHPIGFYLALLWNVAVSFVGITVGYRAIRHSLKVKTEINVT